MKFQTKWILTKYLSGAVLLFRDFITVWIGYTITG